MQDDVFSPSFGNRPSSLVGREPVLNQLVAGLSSKPGSRERSVVLSGQRGSGKTVLLWELADRMRQNGCVVANPTIVSESLLPRLIEKIADALEGLDAPSAIEGPKRHVSGGTVGAFGFSAGVQFQQDVPEPKSHQQRLVEICRALTAKGKGVLFLVDELQANSPELRQLVITYQEMVGEGLNVAIVMAGLPGAVSATLNDKVLTFLNRSAKVNLSPLAFGEVDAFFQRSFRQLGMTVSNAHRRQAAEFTEGSPYMLQLVGHNMFLYAGPEGAIDDDLLANALATSQTEFENDVCQTTLAALSNKDVEFLTALAAIGGGATMAEIAREMGVSPDYAQKYRKRLIDSGIIEAAGRGRVTFIIPHLMDYLRREMGLE